MENRKEITAQSRAAQKKKMIKIIVLALIAGVVAALAFLALNSDNRSITSIEKHIPENASSVFVSQANEDAWIYMNTIAGTSTPYPEGAQNIAVATIEDRIVLYVLDETDSSKNIFDSQSVEYLQKEKVYALTSDNANLVDSGLGDKEEYRSLATDGNNQSFGYVDFPILSKNYPDSLSYSFPKLGKWHGSFKGGKWSGEVTDVDFSKLDEVKAEEQIVGNPLVRSFADNYKYEHNGDNFEGTFNIQDINFLSETRFNTSMRSVEFDINGSSLNFEIR